MKLNLDSIILYVQNVDRLKLFYTDILKLEIVEEYHSQWALLNAGHGKLGLHQIGKEYSGKIKDGYKFDNNVKIVFEIEEDIHEARQRLIDQNVEMRAIKTFDDYGYWLCDGEDPEGNIFQLKQAKS